VFFEETNKRVVLTYLTATRRTHAATAGFLQNPSNFAKFRPVPKREKKGEKASRFFGGFPLPFARPRALWLLQFLSPQSMRAGFPSRRQQAERVAARRRREHDSEPVFAEGSSIPKSHKATLRERGVAILLWVATVLGVIGMGLLLDPQSGIATPYSLVGVPIAAILVCVAMSGTAMVVHKHDEHRRALFAVLVVFGCGCGWVAASIVSVISMLVLVVIVFSDVDLATPVLWGLVFFWIAVICVLVVACDVTIRELTDSRDHDPEAGKHPAMAASQVGETTESESGGSSRDDTASESENGISDDGSCSSAVTSAETAEMAETQDKEPPAKLDSRDSSAESDSYSNSRSEGTGEREGDGSSSSSGTTEIEDTSASDSASDGDQNERSSSEASTGVVSKELSGRSDSGSALKSDDDSSSGAETSSETSPSPLMSELNESMRNSDRDGKDDENYGNASSSSAETSAELVGSSDTDSDSEDGSDNSASASGTSADTEGEDVSRSSTDASGQRE
jgi:hypothetical protein